MPQKKATARMESAVERALRFALLGLLVGLSGALGLGGSIFFFTGKLVLAPIVGLPLGGFVGGFLIAILLREPTRGFITRVTLGRHRPTRSEYSDAQALAIRGEYVGALKRYRHYADENPGDPRPLLHGARLLRDEMRDPAAAVEWLEEALRIQRIDAESDINIVRELTDLLADHLDQPARALPHLARIAERYRDSRAGEWAGRRMAALRTQAWTDVRSSPVSEPPRAPLSSVGPENRNRRSTMAVPDRADAVALLEEWVDNENLRKHMFAVEAAVRSYAREQDADEDVWGLAGLLHDLDWEKYPEEHPLKAAEALRERDYPDEVIHAILAHRSDFTGVEPETPLDRTLVACDELTGLITATALVRPNRIDDLKPKSVKKKMKDSSFASGVDRDDVRRGAELMDVDMTEHIQKVIDAMRGIADELGLSKG